MRAAEPGPAAIQAEPGGRRVVLTDGTPAAIRVLDERDREAVAELHRRLPPDDRQHRYLAGAPRAEAVADRVLSSTAVAVGVTVEGRLAGVGHFAVAPDDVTAELALVVAHDRQHLGIGTLLTEELVARARDRGIRVLTALVANDNVDVLRLVADLGLPVASRLVGSTTLVDLDVGVPPLEPPGLVDAAVARSRQAEAAGLDAVLRPRSVAVIGASRRPGSVGRAILDRLVRGGYRGELVAVNPHGRPRDDVPWVRSSAELATPVDLAVLAVPASDVVSVADECGRGGVRALLVVTSGIVGADADLLRACALRHGMRLVGPNCLGVANTDPQVRLDALFGGSVRVGEVAVAAQSGGVAIDLLERLARLGLGTSALVCPGDGLDVAADDLLAWAGQDGRSRAAVVYLEAVHRPHDLVELARDVGRTIPVVAIRSGSSTAGRRAAASHTASTATPLAVRDALLRQAGILTVDTPARAVAALAALRWSALPAGPRVAVVSNAGGAGVLAADACARAGLTVAVTNAATRRTLKALLPPTAAVGGPVDTTATVTPEVFATVVDAVADDPDVDAVLAAGAETDLADPLAALGPLPTALFALRVGQAERVRRLDDRDGGPIVCFDDPVDAAETLALLVERGRRLARDARPVVPDRVDPVRAATVVREAAPSDDGWLAPLEVRDLLAAAGIPVTDLRLVHDAAAAVALWRASGVPIALKAVVPGLVHKARAGGVVLSADSAVAIEQAVQELVERFGDRLSGIVVQPMVDAGDELLVGVTTDATFGPLLTVGLGGAATDLVADRGHALVPATEADVDEALDEIRGSRRLFRRGGPDRAAVRDIALRLGWLAALLPDITEAELNPLLASAAGAVAVDARVRIGPTRRSARHGGQVAATRAT